jgi:hypothetical protein
MEAPRAMFYIKVHRSVIRAIWFLLNRERKKNDRKNNARNN